MFSLIFQQKYYLPSLNLNFFFFFIFLWSSRLFLFISSILTTYYRKGYLWLIIHLTISFSFFPYIHFFLLLFWSKCRLPTFWQIFKLSRILRVFHAFFFLNHASRTHKFSRVNLTQFWKPFIHTRNKDVYINFVRVYA